MIRTIQRYLLGSVFRRGATALTLLTLISNVLGLARDMLFSHILGTSRILDVYNAAFVVPDIFLNIFVAGALTAAFIPVFSHLRAHEELDESERVASTMLAVAPSAMVIIGILAFIGMPMFAHIVAPGFSESELSLLVRMSRLMLLSPIIFALSNTLGGILVSLDRFVAYGLSPILYNTGIIVGVFLIPFFGPYGLIVGTLSGALLHLTVRLIGVARTSFRARGPIQLHNPHVRRILFLMIPRMAGQPIEQITFSLFISLASTLSVGSIAIMNFARNFQSMPISVIGISFSMAAFATLSRKAALGEREAFLHHFWETAKPLLILSTLATIVYVFFGSFIIQLLLGGGKFGPDAVRRTATLLALFAIAIPAENMIHLLVRSFYALKDTWTPIFISVPGLVITWAVARTLIPTLDINGLGIAYATSLSVQASLLFLLLRRKLNALS